MKSIRIPYRVPDCNAVAERFVKSVKSECSRKMVFIGERSLRRALAEYEEHYRRERAHQGIGNQLVAPGDDRSDATGPLLGPEVVEFLTL